MSAEPEDAMGCCAHALIARAPLPLSVAGQQGQLNRERQFEAENQLTRAEVPTGGGGRWEGCALGASR